MVREGRVFVSSASRPAFGGSYYVHALKPGAQVASASSGTTVTVRAGHGFSANDKFIVGTDDTLFRTVSVAGATSLTINQALSVAQGDILVNLGADTGITGPLYDGNGVAIYSDMDYSNAVTNQRVTTDSNGRYRYYHNGISLWELVRTSTDVTAVYQDVQASNSSGFINVRDYGAVGDGTNDDATAIQAAIDAASTGVGGISGGRVFFPTGNYLIKSTISLPAYVKLEGENYSGISDVYSVSNATTITAGSSFVGTSMFDTTASSQYWGIEINGFRMVGNGLVENIIVLDGTKDARLYNITMRESTKSAVWLINGGAGIGLETRMYNVNAVECNTAPTADYRGVFHVEHSDCFIHNCRARGNGNSAYTYSGMLCGFYFSNGGNFVSDSYADFNEDGWVIDAYGNQFVNCRADLNAGHGWNVTSSVYSGTLVGCYAANNSQAATNTYDGFHCAASRFVFSGCQTVFNGVTNTHKYAYNQVSSFGADNRWIGCNAIPAAYGTALFNDTNQAGGWEFQNSYKVASADDATPTVLNVGVLSVGGNNTTPTQITALDNGIPLQSVRLYCADDTNYPYVINGGNFHMAVSDWYPITGEWIDFYTFNGTLWWETGRSIRAAGYLSVRDGITAPSDTSGRIHFYGDSSDGDFKIKFSGGAVVSITDTGGTLLSTGGNVTAPITVSSSPTNIFPSNRTLMNITNSTGTNTITLEAPSSVDGQIIVLRCAALTAGTFTLADSGNCALSAAWSPTAGDTITLIASGSIWYELARSTN